MEGREVEGAGAPEFRRLRLAASPGLARLSRRLRREGPVELLFRADQSLAALAESLGIPRLEIGGARVDGRPWPLALPPPGGCLVLLEELRPPLPLSGEPRFAVDLQLGRLARLLRLLGFDSSFVPEGGEALLVTSLAESRILLSRDRALLRRRELGGDPRRAMLLRSTEAEIQVQEVLRRFGLGGRIKPLSRCAACGRLLEPVPKALVLGLLPPLVAARYENFLRCPGCGKTYWQGLHLRSLEPLLERLRAGLASLPGSDEAVEQHPDEDEEETEKAQWSGSLVVEEEEAPEQGEKDLPRLGGLDRRQAELVPPHQAGRLEEEEGGHKTREEGDEKGLEELGGARRPGGKQAEEGEEEPEGEAREAHRKDPLGGGEA